MNVICLAAIAWNAAFLFCPPLSAQRAGSALPSDRIFEAIGLRPSGTACEVGAGNGELTIRAASTVGSAGHVFASELGEAHLKTLRDRVAASAKANIMVVAGDPEKTNFPDAGCDALFLRDVYHHFTNPASMDAAIFVALKPGGRVAIIDFTPPGKEASKPEDRAKDGMHGVTAETVVREMKEAGFDVVSSERPDQRWFLAVFARPLR
jgi:ubiquinone/menaquinone biosynthesis C-methylase UbiE